MRNTLTIREMSLLLALLFLVPLTAFATTPASTRLTASVVAGNAPLTLTFEATAGDASYFGGVYIEFGDGTLAFVCNPGTTCSTKSKSYTYSSAGTYTAKLMGVGEGTLTTLGSVQITVNSVNNPVFTVSPASGVAQLLVTFTASSTLFSGIDFGDGTQNACPNSPCATWNPSHTYTTAGTYHARLYSGTTSGPKWLATTTVSVGQVGCTPSWSCEAWTPCLPSSLQVRTCTDANACNVNANKPIVQQSCQYDAGAVGITGATTTTTTNTNTTQVSSDPAIAALQALVAQLTAHLTRLLAQVGGTLPNTTGSIGTPAAHIIACPDPALTRTLSRGMEGVDVASLQRFLIAAEYMDPGEERGAGISPSNVSGFYGALTEAAVQRWQSNNKLVSYGTAESTGYGAVGKLTRNSILRVCGKPIDPTTGTGGVGVASVSTEPAADFDAQPATVEYGKSTNLVWDAKNVGSCLLRQQSTGGSASTISSNLPVKGIALVTPLKPTVFTLICTSLGTGGEGLQRSFTVNVTNIPAEAATTTVPVATSTDPTISISATPTKVDIGQPTILIWKTEHMKSCLLNASPGGKSWTAKSGQQAMSFTEANTYKFYLACVGENDMAYSASAFVNATST